MGIHRLLRSYVTSLADTNCLNQMSNRDAEGTFQLINN